MGNTQLYPRFTSHSCIISDKSPSGTLDASEVEVPVIVKRYVKEEVPETPEVHRNHPRPSTYPVVCYIHFINGGMN